MALTKPQPVTDANQNADVTPPANPLNPVAQVIVKPDPVQPDPAQPDLVTKGVVTPAPNVPSIQQTLMNSASLAPNGSNPNTTIPTGGLSNPLNQTGAFTPTSATSASPTMPDWRLRLSLSSYATYLYKDPAAASDRTNILNPLVATNGIVFPYTPTINVGYKANYDAAEIVHSNYKMYFYKNSNVDEIQITADFTAQDVNEGKYVLAVLHFFRSVTKMFYGQDTDPIAGTPPPLCYLTGYGQYQFSGHPVLVSSFTYSLPNDVDYIRTGIGAAWSGTSITSVISNTVPTTSTSSAIRLKLSKLLSGGKQEGPEFSTPSNSTSTQTLTTDETLSYVPTKMQIQITLLPIITRANISKNFSVKDYASGKLLKGGYW
jgi:hypothetical protein